MRQKLRRRKNLRSRANLASSSKNLELVLEFALVSFSRPVVHCDQVDDIVFVFAAIDDPVFTLHYIAISAGLVFGS